MKISKKAKQKISDKKVRLHLAIGLGKTEQWIIKSIKNNVDNGLLTTVSAVQIIQAETGLTQEQILEATNQQGVTALR